MHPYMMEQLSSQRRDTLHAEAAARRARSDGRSTTTRRRWTLVRRRAQPTIVAPAPVTLSVHAAPVA